MANNQDIRFATFNISLNRNTEGELIEDLSTPDNAQAQAVAEIIQRSNPDVLLLNEFDYDSEGEAIALFQENYLSISQHGSGICSLARSISSRQNEVDAVEYPYVYLAPSNTGIPSEFDLDNDGTTDGAGDALVLGSFLGSLGWYCCLNTLLIRKMFGLFKTFSGKICLMLCCLTIRILLNPKIGTRQKS